MPSLALQPEGLAESVSVVMVSYNTGNVLYDSIASVLLQPELHELILVDNGNPVSIREELQQLAAKEARLKIIINPHNTGFASGCNIGTRQAKGSYLLILNPDCIIPPDTFSRVITNFALFPETRVAGCYIANPDYTEQSGSRRNLLTPWVAIVESLGLHKLLPENTNLPRMNLHTSTLPSSPVYIPAISGAFMMMKRETYQQLGGIDEGYFFHVEDLDFCLQVHKSGGKILYIPDIKVIHYRSTSKVSTAFIERNKTKGFVRYFHKNFKDSYFPGFIPLLTAAIYLRLGCRLASTMLKSCVTSLFTRNKEMNNDSFPIEEQKRIALLHHYPDMDMSSFPTESLASHAPLLLAGASGQVGLCVLRRALKADIPVTALYYRRTIHFSHEKLEWKRINLQNQQLDLSGTHAKTLIYTPALWLLPPALPSFAATGIKRLICFSSTSIFSKAQSGNPYERDLVARLVKAEADIARLCTEYNIAWTILRPTLIYGIGLDRNITHIVHFIRKFGFFPIAGKGIGLRQPVHTDDLAIATFAALECSETHQKSYNLCGGERLSYHEMIGRIFDTLGLKRRIITIPSLPLLLNIYSKLIGKPEINGEIAERMNRDLIFDDSEARQTFDYHPRSFLENGIKDLGDFSS